MLWGDAATLKGIQTCSSQHASLFDCRGHQVYGISFSGGNFAVKALTREQSTSMHLDVRSDDDDGVRRPLSLSPSTSTSPTPSWTWQEAKLEAKLNGC